MIAKPRYSEPCNGCGQCCREELCVYGQILYGDIKGPCPSLRLIGGIYRCQEVLEEAGLNNRSVSRGLGIGVGCSMHDEDTTETQAMAFNAFAMVKTRKLHPSPVDG